MQSTVYIWCVCVCLQVGGGASIWHQAAFDFVKIGEEKSV